MEYDRENAICGKITAAYVFRIFSFEKIVKFVKENAASDDIVIVMGAGNIVNITKEIVTNE